MVNEHVLILARNLAVSAIIALALMGTAMGESLRQRKRIEHHRHEHPNIYNLQIPQLIASCSFREQLAIRQ